MKYFNYTFCMLVSILTVIIVDVTPKACDLLRTYDDSGQVFVSDIYYACPKGINYALLKGGKPEKVDDYNTAEINQLMIYVPKNLSFMDEAVKIIDFVKRDGTPVVGVSNIKEND